jgi:hypothetical protein
MTLFHSKPLKIDFLALARELEKKQYPLFALYTYIRKSQELQ